MFLTLGLNTSNIFAENPKSEVVKPRPNQYMVHSVLCAQKKFLCSSQIVPVGRTGVRTWTMYCHTYVVNHVKIKELVRRR
jgi:hypothetical protein